MAVCPPIMLLLCPCLMRCHAACAVQRAAPQAIQQPPRPLQASIAVHKSHCCLQVRANSLQELVYKQGQAGVTKATVSITFNNLDKADSPVGYEQHDRLVVTRQVSLLCNLAAIQSGCCLH